MGANFETQGCATIAISTDWHPLSEALFDSYQTYGMPLPFPVKRAYDNIVRSGLNRVVDFIVGVDTTTGNDIELTDSGKLKAYYAFGFTEYEDDLGYSFSDVIVEQVVYGGAVMQSIPQDLTTGVLDFTDNGGLYEGTLTLSLRINV